MNSENLNPPEKTEAEIWQIILNNFDDYFLKPAKSPVTGLCDLAIMLRYYRVLTYAERDVILDRLKRQRRKRKLTVFQPFWPYGEIEPRKQFIRDIIKYLNENEQ